MCLFEGVISAGHMYPASILQVCTPPTDLYKYTRAENGTLKITHESAKMNSINMYNQNVLIKNTRKKINAELNPESLSKGSIKSPGHSR